MTALFGFFLGLCGNATVSVALVLAVMALLVLVSNAKSAMLGEPLLFSDLALISAVFRHPQFYLSAIRFWQRAVAGLVAVALAAVLAWLFVPAPVPHLIGVAWLGGGLSALAITLRCGSFRALAQKPAAQEDVHRHGLLPVLLLYWLRWRESRDPPSCPPVARKPQPADGNAAELAVIVQCESFADPVDLFGKAALALPALGTARADAWQWGQLQVSGFGAYTMRTEYGVLFGRDEEELGFRRYDPFLTALGEASHALPNRLKHDGWCSLFLHPHDMRFYGRDRIMPAGGFTNLVGEESFVPPAQGEGRYVTDAAMAEQIGALAHNATQPTLLYAVTIENHGPWAPGDGEGDLLASYLRFVRNSDAMLSRLRKELAALKRPSVLVFFGDHRPSIPGVTMPDGPRHTPYVIMRLDASGQVVRGEGQPVDLSPAGLHHTVLDMLLGEPVGDGVPWPR
ncbi:MAG: LTA synthase family protein [Novosphingobium sp.]